MGRNGAHRGRNTLEKGSLTRPFVFPARSTQNENAIKDDVMEHISWKQWFNGGEVREGRDPLLWEFPPKISRINLAFAISPLGEEGSSAALIIRCYFRKIEFS